MRNRFMYWSSAFLAIALLAVSGLITSCIANFEDLNTHPTDIYEEDFTEIEKVGALFPTMIYFLNPTHENQNQQIEQMIGGQWGGYFVTTNNWEGAIPRLYNPADKYADYPYTETFTKFYPNYFKIAEATHKQGYIYAWATIIRVAVMQRVADIYGPIPYSQMGGGQFAVAYDDLQELYHTMITDLTASVNTLNLFLTENTGSLPIAEYDIMYNGDFKKWVKFANSLKLRMAVRIADVDTEYAKTVMQEAIESGVIDSNADNAFLPSNDNPYHKSAMDWKDLAINGSLSIYMSAYNDPRIGYYMTESAYEKGGSKYIGVRPGIKYSTTTLAKYQDCSKPAYAQNSSLPVFYASETCFLKAEAALKGWIAGGESQAKAYYEKGVTTSMEQYGAAIGNYLEGNVAPVQFEDAYRTMYNEVINDAPTVSWDDGTDKLGKIITQKWIANYPLGLESWAEFRRTGYPKMLTVYTNSSSASYIGSIDKTRMVRRLPYPKSEIDSNFENVSYAITHLLKGEDLGSTDLWWAKKN